MTFRLTALVGSVLVSIALLAAPAAGGKGREGLQMYTVKGAADEIAEVTQGVELAGVEQTARGIKAEAVLTRDQVSKLRASGVRVKLTRNDKGQTVAQQFAAQEAGGFNVWRSWDEPGGIRDELYAVARDNPQLVKLEVLGRTHQGRELIALKLTQGARGVRDGRRPAVLYSSTQHAREWISLEVNRRTLHHFINRWRANDREIRDLLRSTELWFVIVGEPRRLPVQPRRRAPVAQEPARQQRRRAGHRWRRRRPQPQLQRALGLRQRGLLARPGRRDLPRPLRGVRAGDEVHAGSARPDQAQVPVEPALFGEWLLYPQGWQIGTLDADNPIYVAAGGTDANSVIEGFNPGQSADTLYVTNGETTDYAETSAGTIAYTPELGEGEEGAGFVFPDNEALIQAEFERLLPFHLGLARSGANPANPDSPVGIDVEPFYLDQDDIDPQNGQQSLFDFKFSVSYGDPQEVRVLAKRSLGRVTLNYQVNGGATQTASTSEWDGGERYGVGNGTYYHVVRGQVTGTDAGDSVRVWFTGGGETSDSFTYRAVSERRPGCSSYRPRTTRGPHRSRRESPRRSTSRSTRRAHGPGRGVRRVRRRRPRPHGAGQPRRAQPLRRRLWYTGDDVVTREPGWGPGNASRLAMQELLEVRDFVNEGGRVLYTGKHAGQQYTPGLGTQLYDPFENRQCRAPIRPSRPAAWRCRLRQLAGRPDRVHVRRRDHLGRRRAGSRHRRSVRRRRDRRSTRRAHLGVQRRRQRPEPGLELVVHRHGRLPEVTDPASSFPQFESWPAAEYRSGLAGPFDPHTGRRSCGRSGRMRPTSA